MHLPDSSKAGSSPQHKSGDNRGIKIVCKVQLMQAEWTGRTVIVTALRAIWGQPSRGVRGGRGESGPW